MELCDLDEMIYDNVPFGLLGFIVKSDYDL